MNTGIIVLIIILFIIMAGAALWWFLIRKQDNQIKPAFNSPTMMSAPAPTFTQIPVQATADDSYSMRRDMRINNAVNITKAGLLAAASTPRIMPIRNEPLIGPQRQRNFIRGDLNLLPRMGGPQIPIMATLPFHETGIKCAI